MAHQYTLSFSNIPDYSAKSYKQAESDRDLWLWLEKAFLNNTYDIMQSALIEGVKHSGKTHLCHALQERMPSVRVLNGRAHRDGHPFDVEEEAVIVDDADKAGQVWLFHLFNHIKEKRGKLLLMFSCSYLDVYTLPDLCSRLTTIHHFKLSLPDDSVMKQILNKRFTDLGLRVEDAVIDKIILHIERSYGALEAWALFINKRSAEEQKKVTLKFVSQLLAEKGL